MAHHLHLGDLLVQHGVLTQQQRDEVLLAQTHRGGPFGVLAEEMFGVSPQAVERAWSEQYASFTPPIDPRNLSISSAALDLITRRQAWQFAVLPIELRPDKLVLCTTQEHLVRALRFAGWRLGHICHFVLSHPHHLGVALCDHYPLPGMTPSALAEPIRVMVS